jgi:hypothetical protein
LPPENTLNMIVNCEPQQSCDHFGFLMPVDRLIKIKSYQFGYSERVIDPDYHEELELLHHDREERVHLEPWRFTKVSLRATSQ